MNTVSPQPRSFPCMIKTLSALVCLSSFVPAPLFATDYVRVSGAGAEGDWADAAKWSPDTSFPQTINDSAAFNSGASEYEITLSDSQTVGVFGVGYGTSAAATGSIRLVGAAHSVTVGSEGAPGSVYIGGGTTTTGNTVGSLTLGSGVGLQLLGEGSSFYLGGLASSVGVGNHASSGALALEAGSSLSLGSSGARSQWIIGRQLGEGSSNKAIGSFSATGGSLSAHLTTLVVGENQRGANNANHSGVGTLNLEGLSAATVDTITLAVGKSNQSNADGSLMLGNTHTLSVGVSASGSVEVGVRNSGSGAGTHTNTVSGLISLGAGSSTAFGSESSRVSVLMGSNNGQRGSNLIAEGSIIGAAGSTFSGHLSSLTLGTQLQTAVGKTYRATGIIDLRAATVTAFDVLDDVVIGYSSGSGEGGQGELRLPEVSGVIGGNLTVGDSEVGGGGQVSSRGLLDLDGTHLTVNGNVRFNQTGRATVSVNGASAGLLLSEDSTFTLTLAGTGANDPNSSYYINFEDPQTGGLYYGFAWVGDHRETLDDLVNGFYITWNNNMSGGQVPGVFYDSTANLTYIGIPEPSTTALLLLSLISGAGVTLRRRSA